eukprot:gene58764-80474_t
MQEAGTRPAPRRNTDGCSDEELAAIRRNRRSRNEAGIIRSEEDNAAGDFFRFTKPADRDLRDDALVEHLL